MSTLFTGIGAALLRRCCALRSLGHRPRRGPLRRFCKERVKYVHRIDGAGLFLESVAGMVYAAVAGAICGASKADIAVYAVIGLTSSIAVHILGTRSLTEAAVRPMRDSTGRRHRLGRRTARAIPALPNGQKPGPVGCNVLLRLGRCLRRLSNRRVSRSPGDPIADRGVLPVFFGLPDYRRNGIRSFHATYPRPDRRRRLCRGR